MKECKICYEIKLEKHLPCSHTVCHECYDKLQGDNCPYCRTPFRETSSNNFFNTESELVEPDYWLDYQRNGWVTYSRYLRNGSEIIRVFRRNDVPESWRNDDMTTIIKKRRLRKIRRI